MSAINVSIEQWRSLNAVIEAGGFSQAAEKLHRSQSSISYQIARLQEQLGIQVLEIIGRKAQLTEHGEIIYRRSQQLLREADRIEVLARSLDQGWEANISLVVDTVFPTRLLMQALRIFAPESRGTRVQLNEVVLSGAEDALHAGTATPSRRASTDQARRIRNMGPRYGARRDALPGEDFDAPSQELRPAMRCWHVRLTVSRHERRAGASAGSLGT